MVELKPCPFCGEQMEERGYGAIHIEAGKCILGGNSFINITAWNTRAPDPSITAERDELVKALEFYDNTFNWLRDGALDPNSGNFTAGPAREILARIKSELGPEARAREEDRRWQERHGWDEHG